MAKLGERPGPLAGEAVTPVQTCELRHFVEPCLLLLLRERPGHGYELVDRLRTAEKELERGRGDGGGRRAAESTDAECGDGAWVPGLPGVAGGWVAEGRVSGE